MSATPITDHHVVIIGCGFGGLEAAKALGNRPGVRVTVLDRHNHHLFQPLLYQVASAGLAAPSVAAPIRFILRRYGNITVLMRNVLRIDKQNKTVLCEIADGSDTTPHIALQYDTLIIAAGATHSYFGNDHWAQFAPGLKTLDDAQRIRARILSAYELAEAEPERADALLTFVVIGAGPTGVEMAGAMSEIARHTLKHEFRNIDPTKARVLLLEGGPAVLATYSADLSEKAQAQLARLGVEVRLNARVTGIDEHGVQIGEERIAAHTVVWAAGVRASPIAASLDVPLDRAGRVIVNETLNAPGSDDIFVVGDLAAATSDGKPVPGVSPSAKQMGRHVAQSIRNRSAGRSKAEPFIYKDYGSLATIGRKSAIVDLRGFKMWGLPAWLFWLFVHVYFLIGFRNRFFVLIDWAWSYVSYARSARVILSNSLARARSL